MIVKFRKKPEFVEAIQFCGDFEEIEQFCGGDAEFKDGRLVVATPNGAICVSDSDWIMKKPDGTFCVCTSGNLTKEYVFVSAKFGNKVGEWH